MQFRIIRYNTKLNRIRFDNSGIQKCVQKCVLGDVTCNLQINIRFLNYFFLFHQFISINFVIIYYWSSRSIWIWLLWYHFEIPIRFEVELFNTILKSLSLCQNSKILVTVGLNSPIVSYINIQFFFFLITS